MTLELRTIAILEAISRNDYEGVGVLLPDTLDEAQEMIAFLSGLYISVIEDIGEDFEEVCEIFRESVLEEAT